MCSYNAESYGYGIYGNGTQGGAALPAAPPPARPPVRAALRCGRLARRAFGLSSRFAITVESARLVTGARSNRLALCCSPLA